MVSLIKKYFSHYRGINFFGWLVLIANLINRLGSSTVLFLSVYLNTKLNYPLMQIGFLLGVYGFGCIAGSLLGGVLSDIIKPILILIFSLIVSAFVFVLLVFSKSYYILIFVLLSLGLIISLGQPAINLVLNSCVTSENRLKIFSLYKVTNNIGVSITGLIGGLVAAYGFKYLFYLDGITSFLSACCLLFFLKKFHRNQNGDICKKETLSTISFKDVLFDKYFMALWAVYLLVLLLFIQMTTSYPIYLQEFYKLNIKWIGFLYAINGILIAIFQVPLSNKVKQNDLHLFALIGVMFIGIGFGILPLGTSFIIAIFSCVILTFGEILFFPVNTTLVLNHIDFSQKGKYMAIYDVAFSISRLFFPFVGMFLYQSIGGNTLWLMFLAISIMISIFLSLVYRNAA